MLPGVEEAIARLNRSGRKVIVVTNQRGIALRTVFGERSARPARSACDEHLAAHGAHLDAIYYCPHDNGQCNCRKPQTGMFEQAFRDFPDATCRQQRDGRRFSCPTWRRPQRLGMRSILIADPGRTPKPEPSRRLPWRRRARSLCWILCNDTSAHDRQ